MKLTLLKTSGILVAGVTMLAAAIPAMAQVNVGAGLTVTANGTSSAVGAGLRARVGLGAYANASGTMRQNMIDREENRSDTEITNRINSLNALEARINAMVRVSSDDKAGLSTSIQNQISALTQLQAKIQADASSSATSTLKDDMQSIVGAFRIYMLVEPQAQIAAASDRVMTIVSMFQTVGTKLQARISAAQASGTDVTAMTASYTDMTAKIADAQTQAQAAVSETATLTPDNGVTSTMQSNVSTLKDARTKIQAAQKDLITARADAASIIKTLGKLKVSGEVNASGTAQ